MEQSVILQRQLPVIPWMEARLNRLPGILPLRGSFLARDEVYAAQMALRDHLIATRLGDVYAPGAADAAQELLDLVLAQQGYAAAGQITRPDGVAVTIDRAAPLITLGRLVQEDLVILTDAGAEYRLAAAILCFPASWTLAEKIGRPMMAIHGPVASYTPDLGARVHRMLASIRPDQGLWRMNHLTYADPYLFHPRREDDPRPAPRARRFVRCERQCLIRLPQTRAVVFSIHTYVLRLDDLSLEARAALGDHPA